MVLRNLQFADRDAVADLCIKDGRIDAIGGITGKGEHEIIFEHAMIFPGLINSHDHLDFNLFRQLGNRKYNNYVEWGADINTVNKQAIDDVLKVPKHLRVRWGIYKNLINGITTVVNHGERLSVADDLIHVFQKCHNLHSIQIEKGWKYKLNRPFIKKWPVAIHVGEGTDDNSHLEIDSLIRWNILNRKLVGIHGIAMNERQAESFKALVWCPSSNYFLIGKTAPVDRLKSRTHVLFGTDSTVSATWSIWEHIQLARATKYASDEALYNMLTATPAAIWKLEKNGQLKETYQADIVVARQKDGFNGYDAFYATMPEDILLVMRKGDIKLFDASLLKQMGTDGRFLNNFSKIRVGNAVKYIYGDLPTLMAEVQSYYPGAVFPVYAV